MIDINIIIQSKLTKNDLMCSKNIYDQVWPKMRRISKNHNIWPYHFIVYHLRMTTFLTQISWRGLKKVDKIFNQIKIHSYTLSNWLATKVNFQQGLGWIFKISGGRENFGREFGTIDFPFSKYFFQIFCTLSSFLSEGHHKLSESMVELNFQ